MAVDQFLVEVPKDTDFSLGKSGTARLRKIFTQSPTIEELTDDERREFFQKEVLNAVINDGGHTFGTFNTSYEGAPNISEDVATGGGGAPATPHVPNPVSPGQGSVNPTDQAEAPEEFGKQRSDVPFAGPGSNLEPANSSEAIASQKFKSLTLGKSS